MGSGGDLQSEDVLHLLSSLVEQSLVVVEAEEESANRYRLLVPVREYAEERLDGSGEAEETRRRHAEYYLALAENAHPKLRGPEHVEWLDRLDCEHDNLRAAMSAALTSDQVDVAARLAWALHVFWWIRGYQNEGRRWLEQVLAQGSQLQLFLRTRTLMAVVGVASGQTDYGAVERYTEELMDLSEKLGRDPHAEAYAQAGLSFVATDRGDYCRASAHLKKALELFIKSHETGMASQVHTWLGTVELLQGEYGRAELRFTEGLALARGMGDRLGICTAFFSLAQLALVTGDYDTASCRFMEGIRLSQEMGDRLSVAHSLQGLAVIAGARGDADRAARLLGIAEGIIQAVGLRGHSYYQATPLLYERTIAQVRAGVAEETYVRAQAEGRAMLLEQAVQFALDGDCSSSRNVRS